MHSPRFTKFRFPTLVLLLSAAFIAGCSDEPENDVQQASETPRMIEREAPQRPSSGNTETDPDRSLTDFRVVPDLEGKLEEDGMGLETIIDASSKKAYADSMAWIAEDVSAKQYQRLERSLRYIRSYDPAVLGNEQRFLQLIDGKTGEELIKRASGLMQERRG